MMCNWQVDLSALPSFQRNANMPSANGFYTGTSVDDVGPSIAHTCPLSPPLEFELGLELDSAEVRGVLIHEGQDWGHISFDYRI